MKARRGALVGLLGVVVACGPSKGGSTEGGSTEGGSSGGGSSGGGVTEGGQCGVPPGEPVGPPVTITITNMRATPVYLDGTLGCSPVSGYRIVPAGSDKPLPIDPDCQFACEDVLAGIECACQLGCPADSVRRLDPGESMVSSWSGGQIVAAKLAEGCGSESCGGNCVIQGPAPAGAYTLVVPASSTITDCQDPCECPPEEVPCVVTGLRGADDLAVEVMWSYPDETELAVVFQ